MGDYTYQKRTAPRRRRYRPYIIAGTLAFIMTMFFAPEVNEGNAMAPALTDGDVTLIYKKSYSANRGIPEEGQVVLLEKDPKSKLSADNVFARVVGLPKDRMELRQGEIYRNGKLYKAKDGNVRTIEAHKTGTWQVGEDEVFLLCDNGKAIEKQGYPLPGLVKMKEIKGDAKGIIWPLSHIGGMK